MNALAVIDIGQKATDPLVSIVKVLIVRQVDFFFTDRTFWFNRPLNRGG